MTDLGPVGGRTKHTADERWTEPPRGRDIIASKRAEVRAELERMRIAVRLMAYTLVIIVVALAAFLGYVKLDRHMSAPERERRIDACATAMASESARESAVVPIPACEALSPSERHAAAYLYARREGLL